MAVPAIPGSTRLPPGMMMAVSLFWDTTANSGEGGWVPQSGAGAPDVGASVNTAALEALATALNGYVDGLEALLASSNGYTDGLETLLTTLAGHVDGLEGLLAAPSTGTITSVNDTNADTTILASNAARKGATFFNDSTAILYLALANVTASATVYTVQVPPAGHFELPVCKGGVYTGIVKGIWASDASGAVRVTELT